jgi:bacterioferritin
MKGHPDVLSALNELLTHDLTAADLYLAFARTLHRQGYGKLVTRLTHEAEEERLHAERLIQRILLLEGTPDVLSRLTVQPPTDAVDMLRVSLEYEVEVAKRLNRTIALCDQHGDAGTRTLLQELLRDTEEDHIDWLETQLELVAALGEALYLAQQL